MKAKIKVIWKDGSESYVVKPHHYTQFTEYAHEYPSILVAARSARIIQRTDELVKEVKIISGDKEYIPF